MIAELDYLSIDEISDAPQITLLGHALANSSLRCRSSMPDPHGASLGMVTCSICVAAAQNLRDLECSRRNAQRDLLAAERNDPEFQRWSPKNRAAHIQTLRVICEALDDVVRASRRLQTCQPIGSAYAHAAPGSAATPRNVG